MRNVITTVLMLAASAAFAQQQAQRFAVIDVDRLVQESAAGKEMQARLQRLASQKQADFEKLRTELDTMQQQLSTQRATLAEAKIAELQKQIEDKDIAMQRFEADARQELQQAQQREEATLNDQIMPIISELGREMGFHLIFNKYRAGLLYADESTDITDQVLRRFNTKVTQ